MNTNSKRPKSSTMFKLMLGTLAILASNSALAEEVDGFGNVSTEANTGGNSLQLGFKHPYIFGGFDVGPTYTSPQSLSEGSRSGSQTQLKLLGSVYITHFVFDLGGGWAFNNISGTQGSGSATQQVSIDTRAAFAEFSPRVRVLGPIQLGLVSNVMFGTDTTLQSDIGHSSALLLGGAQAVVDLPLGGNRIRGSVRWETTLNDPGRNAQIVQVGFQFGLPVTQAHSYAVSEASSVDEPLGSDLQMDLGSDLVHFATGSAKLDSRSHQFLVAVGAFLAAHPDAWQDLKIEGHTDQRGDYQYNLELSKNRASAVRQALAEGGVSESRLKALGYSSKRPLLKQADEAAWAQNRRVEISFYGLTDASVLKSGLAAIERRLGSNSNITWSGLSHASRSTASLPAARYN